MGQKLLAKVDKKAMNYMIKWRDERKEAWLEEHPDSNETIESLDAVNIESEDGGETLHSFDKTLFSNIDAILADLEQTVNRKEVIEEVAEEQARLRDEQKRKAL
jgi:hypothetical protein